LGLAVVALFACGLTLDSSGAVARLPGGPGLTLDETFNVQMGVYHARALREYGVAIVHPQSVREVFGARDYNPDHPPLGRLLIGIAHELTAPLLRPDVPVEAVTVTCGRAASAGLFALTVLLIGTVTGRWYGTVAGAAAAASLLLMPRLFAHAHLASLETGVGLLYAATVLCAADGWQGPRRPRWGWVVAAGVLLGLTLLTKIQGVLLPIPLAVWALWRWHVRGLWAVVIFGLVGVLVFFVGWPWLWLDPMNHLREYFGRTTERQVLSCWYLGTKWADRDVPWHYSWVMFLTTVPLGLHALGIAGLSVLRRSPSPVAAQGHAGPGDRVARGAWGGRLVLLNVLWPLAFFGLPGITVYDGSRLFLMVFPLWGVLIGAGFGRLTTWLKTRWGSRLGPAVLGCGLLLQSYGVIALHPCQLSYYNLLVGGLRGASRLGFEVTYWGDSLTRDLLALVADDGPHTVYVAPVLHPFQLQELMWDSPAFRSGGVVLRAFDQHQAADVRRVLVVRRQADSWPALTPAPPRSRLLAEVRREGVQLAGYYEVSAGAFVPRPPTDPPRRSAEPGPAER
jgi:hypothetical protein